jgi:2-methylcitrate dehydratase PrpD
MMNITDSFIDHLYAMANEVLPERVKEQAALCAIDYIGCAAAGSKMMAARNMQFLNLVKKQGGNSSIIGSFHKTDIHNAAFLNAMNAHATELDDGHRLGMIHLGASIFSALMAVAEMESIAKEKLLQGVVVGYEAAVLTAMAMQPSHKVRGYHTSGTCGTIGSAMAIAAAMHFTKNEMKSTLAAATAGASGLLEMQEDDSELKPYNLAHAAVAGITAAYAAKAGYTGPTDPLGGKRGLLAVMSENAKTELLTRFEPGIYEIERIYRKPYAACRHCHPAIEAALSIKHEHGLMPEDIASVQVETYKLAVGGHDHKEIQGVASAKLSTPFSVALALITDKAGIDDFNITTIENKTILGLCQRVEVVSNEELTSWSPQKRAAIVNIITKEGVRYSCEIDYPKGEPENPMTRKDVIEKYKSLAVFAGMSNEQIESYSKYILE